MNKWEIICDDHKTYNAKHQETNTLLAGLEEKVFILQSTTSSDINEKMKKLQSIVADRDRSSAMITDYVTCGESILPDTATMGREIIRREMKEIRERCVPHSIFPSVLTL